MKKISFKTKVLYLLALSAILFNCGGGGGGGSSGTSSNLSNTNNNTPTQPINQTGTPLIQNAPTVDESNRGSASFPITFSANDTIVGIIDNGFDNSLSVFKDASGNVRISVDNSFSTDSYSLLSGYSHGTLVSKTLAEQNNSVKIYAINGGEKTGGITISSKMYEKLYSYGVRIYNQSFGSATVGVPTRANIDVTGNALYKFYHDKATSDSLFIWAAGNGAVNGAEEPTSDALIPVLYDEMRRGWMVVTAVDSNKVIQSYANKVGSAKNWGISAYDTYEISRTTDASGTVHVSSTQGTSFATPTVAAAAASVKTKFPWMNGDIIRQTLLSTADDIGVSGVDSTYGWGLLNLTKALKGPALFDKRLTQASDNYNVVVNFNNTTSGYTNDQVTFSNNIGGDAGLLKIGNGNLILSGYNSYSGDTTVNGGSLTVTGRLSSNVNVGSNGALLVGNPTGKATLTKNLINNGIVYVGGKGVSLSGNYIGSSTSGLYVDIVNSKIDVSGSVNFGNSNIHLEITQEDLANHIISSTVNSTKVILTATGNISNLAGYNKSTDVNKYLTINAVSGGNGTNNITVDYIRNTTVYTASAMGYVPASVINTGKNLDSVFNNLSENDGTKEFKTAAASIIMTPSAALPRVWDSLSGEIYSTSQNLIFKQSKELNKDLSNRLVLISNEENKGGVGFWFNGLGADGKIYQKGYAKADTTSWGGQVGVDSYFTDNLILGASLSAVKSDADFNKYAGEGKSTGVDISLYGIYDFANSGLYTLGRVGVGVGFVDSDVERDIYTSATTFDHIKTSHDDTVYSGYAELGYKIGLTDNFKLTPYIGLMYDNVKRGSFNEHKSQFGLNSGSKNYDQFSGVVGLRADVKINKVKLNANVTEVAAFNKEDLSFDSHYTGDTTKTKYEIKGVGLPKNTTWVGIGAEYDINEKMSVNASYDISIERSKVSDNVVSVGFRFKF